MTALLIPWVLGLTIAVPAETPAAKRERVLVPSITVVGSGKVSARPDMALVQVGVQTQAPTAARALEQNNEAMKELFKALEARGVARKDIQTTAFNVTPQYRHDQKGRRQPEVVGYQVINQVRVKVRRLDDLGVLLDELVRQGANRVQGIQFAVADADPLLQEARRRAMADARQRAEVYAQSAAVKLGRVLLIQEQAPRRLGPQYRAAERARAVQSVPVARGEQEFRAHVTVTYAIE